jgi:hypothetical protein
LLRQQNRSRLDVVGVDLERADAIRNERMGSMLIAGLVGLAVGSAAATAHAQTLQITGTTGYLSEWKFEVALAKKAPDDDEFAGPLRWKHVGLCSANGPEEKTGEINVQIRRMGPWSRVNATVSFEQLKCTYRGPFSSSVRGFMECSDRTSLPLALLFNDPAGALVR